MRLNPKLRPTLRSSLALVAGLAFAAGAAAQATDYPNRPIRVVVPFSADGAVDGPMRYTVVAINRTDAPLMRNKTV